MKLHDFRALSFDCYGTLIDWETGLANALEPLVIRSGTGLSSDQILEAYGRLEHEVEEEQPDLIYSQVLAEVHWRLADLLGATKDEEESNRFGASVGNWPAFPDSTEALAYLKQHFRLVILSNVDQASFAGSNRRLGVEFDEVLTAEEIGSYKPDPRNFRFLVDRLDQAGIAKGEILHVAQSLFHDHVPANAIGLKSAWIDRRHGRARGGATKVPDPMPRVDFRFTSLAALADAHRAEQC